MQQVTPNIPMAMMHPLFTIAVAVMISGYATAQVQPPLEQSANDVGNACIIATDLQVWTSLDLSDDQLKQVQAIQTKCKTDCNAVSETGEQDPHVSGAVLKRYQEQLKKILNKDQYDKWMKWCNERPGQM